MTVLDPTGRLLETVPYTTADCGERRVDGQPSPCRPVGALADGTVVFAQEMSAAHSPNDRLPIVTDGLMTSVGVFDGKRISIDDSIAQPVEVFALNDHGIRHLFPRPFDGPAAYAVGPRHIALGDGDRFEIRFLNGRGDLVQVLRVARPAAPVTQRLLAAYSERQGIRSVIDAVGAGDSVPHFRALLIDDDDRLWLQDYLPDASGSAPWTVLNSDGTPLARITLPNTMIVSQIGSDFILGVEFVGDFVQDLVMHAIERPPLSPSGASR